MFKIVSTIGPNSSDQSKLRKIIALSDLIRLNGAHNTFNWHKRIIKKIKKINNKIPILIDLPGTKPRTLNNHDINVKKGQIIKFIFTNKNFITEESNIIFLSNPLPKKIKKKKFSVSDGNYEFLIIKKKQNEIIAKSSQNFTLNPRKGVNFPNSYYDEKFQEKKYLNLLKKFNKLKPDAIGLSYIQTSEIIKKIKKKFKKLILVSKIENYFGLLNSDDISQYSDIVMIDRGDLSAEIGDENLFKSIKLISQSVKKFGKPLIMATENLDSMLVKSNPSKSEIVALGYNIDLGADCIMLSEETALSKECLNILKWLDSYRKKISVEDQKFLKNNDFVVELLKKIKNQTIVVFSKKGYAIELISSFNNFVNLILFTDNKKLENISSLRKNTTCILTKKFDNKNLEKFIYENIKKNKKIVFKKDKNIIILRIIYPMQKSRANNISFVNEKNFT